MSVLKKILVLTLSIYTVNATAQHKLYTIKEATNGMRGALAPESLDNASWQPTANKLHRVVKAGKGEAWIATKYPENQTDTITFLKELNKKIYGEDKLKSIPAIKWLDESSFYFQKDNDIKKGTLTAGGIMWEHWFTLPEKAENVTIDKHMNIAYTIENNLWLVTPGKQTHQVTNDNNKGIVNGQSVHRNEFGIEGGIFFSPQGNYLAYYRMDETMVREYPIVRWLTDAKADMIRYPMAGGPSHHVELCVYNITTGKTVTMQTAGPKDQYLTSVTWGPKENFIYLAILNRDQNHLALNQYNIHNGVKVKTLFEEKDDKYVEPLHPLTFIPGDNDKFIWWSQRDGWMHLYLYNTEGKLIRQLTKGNWLVNELAGTNKGSKELIITSSKESPLEKHAYTVNWNTGRMQRIDEGPGWHSITANDNGSFILDEYSAADVPKRTVVRAVDSKYDQTLIVAKNTLAEYERPEIRNVTLKADDGTPLYGKLVLPTNFDANKKYPVIVYLYNGPHVQLIRNYFPESGNLWYEYMAQRGYVVFSMDGRGSSNRSLKFEQAVFRRLGTVEMEDQLKGVEYLKSLPFVDDDRMGVHGWSFGGFMTTSLMLRHPGVFKVGVAGGPVIDWKMYEVMYTERYMDTPQDNPEGYETANLLPKVKNLQGKLLLIHGTDDNVVVWQHSIKFLREAVSEDVQIDYFVYPGYEHNVRGKDRVHLMQKITDYFDTYLK